MDHEIECRLAGVLAREIRESSEALARQWVERIEERVAREPGSSLSDEEPRGRFPALVEGIAAYVEDPVEEMGAELPVIARAVELGDLRHAQGFRAERILREYELLGGVLFEFLVQVVDETTEPCPPAELLSCAYRVFRAIEVVQQVTTAHFLELAQERVKEREERLRSFNRMVTHELKNRIGAAVGAAEMLREEWVRGDSAQVERFAGIVVKNAQAVQGVLADLLELSQTDTLPQQGRSAPLPEAAREVVHKLREAAAEASVEIRLLPDLPDVEVNAPVMELCLTNYLTNAIKYCDRDAAVRWVEIGAEVRSGGEAREVVVWARDNGIGVPPDVRDGLFQRFFRADAPSSAEVEGTGLGLSIVRETVEALGGEAWAEFDQECGSNFKFSLPLGERGEAHPAG